MEWAQVPARKHDANRLAVWDLYVSTYNKIGLIINDPDDLDEYDHWDVFVDDDDNIRAFSLSKTTKYGLKRGLSGSDGTQLGKKAVKEQIAEALFEPGVYGEVSHAVEHLAVKAGVPVVCASDAAIVLNKQIRPLPDGVHYERNLAVGPIVKLMVGRPVNVRTTSASAPRCSINSTLSGPRRRKGQTTLGDAALELAEHLANMAL